MTRCENIQQQLAALEPGALQDNAKLQQHLAGCPECSEFLEQLQALDADLTGLTEQDASDALVNNTLAAIEQAGAPAPAASHFERYRFRWASGFASVFVVVSVIGLWQAGLRDFVVQREFDFASSPEPSIASADDGWTGVSLDQPSLRHKAPDAELRQQQLEPTGQLAEMASSNATISPLESEESNTARLERYRQNQQAALDELKALTRNRRLEAGEAGRRSEIAVTGSDLSQSPASALPRSDDRQFGAFAKDSELKAEEAPFTEQETDELQLQILANEVAQVAQKQNVTGPGEKFRDTHEISVPSNSQAKLSADKLDQLGDETTGLLSSHLEADKKQKRPNRPPAEHRAEREQGRTASGPLPASEPVDMDNSGPAREFLDQLDSLEGVTYQPAAGYWSHNYVPGDPAMRLLQAQLDHWQRISLGDDFNLSQPQPIWQPFDLPENAALATYLHSDKTHIDGPTRLRVQIGLQASEREGGQRPAMNLAVVLDLRGTTGAQFHNEIRALLNALSESRQSGDRFSLTIAGQPGGLIIPAGDFRHGPLTVAIQQLFGEQTDQTATSLDLADAIRTASDNLMTSDAADATLGANLMLLVTAAPIGSELPALQRQVHQNALDGLLLSALSLGGNTVNHEMEKLVLAGQGHRRALLHAGEAKALIDTELYAASRAVARAIRLRIQLAPGVRLVNVHGSERLDAAQIERVKQAEDSIDQRLSDNLGIAADRGEDEAGIQMVIPAMAAGTSHVILLDVVAEQPGPIADVRVRYKDLVHLDNAVARARLDLDEQPRTAGKLERNVIKNLLALELAETFSLASDRLAAGDISGAKTSLFQTQQLLRGVRREWPEWQADPELLRDENLLAGYQQALNWETISDARNQRYLVYSMALAAHRKVAGPID